jgi:hypothetical protein
MKPFDLEAFRNGDIALTRDGGEVKFVAECSEKEFPRLRESHRLVYATEYGIVTTRTAGTRYPDRTHPNDLVGMKPKEVTYWVNVFKNNQGVICSSHFPYTSKAFAEEAFEQLSEDEKLASAVPLTITL